VSIGVETVEFAGMLLGGHGAAKDPAHGVGDNIIEAAIDFGGDFFDNGFQFAPVPALDAAMGAEQE